MSIKHLDDRTIIVEYEHPTYLPERPEPPAPAIRWLDAAAVKKKFNWDQATYEATVTGEGFPIAQKRPRLGGWGADLVWTESVLDDWAARQREKADAILKLLHGVK